MTFYKLLGHKTLKTPEEHGLYLESDMNWLKGSIRPTKIEIGDWAESGFSAAEKLREGDYPEGTEAKMAGAIFLADSEYLSGNIEWFEKKSVKMLIELGDSSAHHKMADIAERYYTVSELQHPSYSTPEQFQVDGEKVEELTDSFTQRAILAATVTSIDWLEYILTQMDAENYQQLLSKTREQSVEYLTGKREKPEDEVGEFLAQMFLQDIKWTKDLEEKFEFNSMLANHVCGKLQTKVDELKNSHS